MTKEEKQIFLNDLCARLPHYTMVLMGDGGIEFLVSVNVDTGICNGLKGLPKPYLRPMSSMTAEEEYEYHQYKNIDYLEICKMKHTEMLETTALCFSHAIDWLNAHHFDYRGLISMGLALEAPDGMYNKEESEKVSEITIPKTVDEAVKTLAKIISKEDKDYILENGAISMHDSLGRCIRNEWGLWTGSELKDELMNKGFNHPDDMSNYIIEEFIEYLNKYGVA